MQQATREGLCVCLGSTHVGRDKTILSTAVAKNYSCAAPKAPGYSSLSQPSGSLLSSLRSSALPMLGDFPVMRQSAWDATLLLRTEGLCLPSLSPGRLCPAPGHSGLRFCRWIRRVDMVSVLTSKSSVWVVNAPFSKQSPAGQRLVRKIHGGRGEDGNKREDKQEHSVQGWSTCFCASPGC